jgi:hypothetical protein
MTQSKLRDEVGMQAHGFEGSGQAVDNLQSKIGKRQTSKACTHTRLKSDLGRGLSPRLGLC